MSGLSLEFDQRQISILNHRLNSLLHLQTNELSEGMGATLENQTRRRISDEKAAPDGTPWEAWSEDYTETRHGGHSLLENEGDLLDSLQYHVSTGSVEVGSNLVYAAIQHFGAEKHQFDSAPWGDIPARPYLGISDDNLEELNQVLDDWAREQVGL